MKKINYLLVCLVAALTSCGSGGSGFNYYLEQIDYIPFQSEKDGNWGLIGTDGEVLFDGEFENRPTFAIHDRFMVKNADDMWEIYTTDKKPKQVGEAFKSVGVFFEDVAPAVKKGQCITLIDTDGEEVAKLDKLDGKTVVSIRNFAEGIAIYQTDEGYYGAVNTSGKMVIPANYIKLNPCFDGKLLAIDKKYEKTLAEDSEKVKYTVLDKNGKVISELSGSKFTDLGYVFTEGVLAAATGKDSEKRYGLIDEKGEWVVKPGSKVKAITAIKDKKFVFYDGENCGLMNFDGEVLIRAKYDGLFFAGNDLLFAKKDGSSDERWTLINYEGEAVGDNKFHDCDLPFLNSGYTIVELSENEYAFIDKEGKEVKIKTDIYRIDFNEADNTIESDYVDIDGLVNALKITKDGMDGLTFSADAQAIANHLNQATGSSEAATPNSWTYRNSGNYTKSAGPISIALRVDCSDYLARYAENEIGDYDYIFSDATVTRITAEFNNYGKLEGKLKEVNEKFRAAVKKLGTVQLEEENVLNVMTTNGNTIIIGYAPDSSVTIEMSNAPAEPDSDVAVADSTAYDII